MLRFVDSESADVQGVLSLAGQSVNKKIDRSPDKGITLKDLEKPQTCKLCMCKKIETCVNFLILSLIFFVKGLCKKNKTNLDCVNFLCFSRSALQ